MSVKVWWLMVIRVKKEKPMRKVFIIAEAGVNHNGNLKTAKKMVDAAVNAGADAVKFQTFNAELLVSRYALKARYQKKNSGKDETQLAMLKKLELDEFSHRELFSYCRKKKIIFLSTPFDLKSIDLLVRLGLQIFKIPSGEITNMPYLRKISALKKRVIISTGMATLAEVKNALDILLINGTRKDNVTVLHCNTGYPTPFKDANLLAMLTIKNKLGISVGYSDHTLGIEASIAAVALGASVIEKHFTLNKNMSGPDHKASLDPKELKNLVVSVRNTEKALGCGFKRPSPSEIINMPAARKSIVASKDIKKGVSFSEENLSIKRPGTGVSPMKWNDLLGRVAKKDFYRDELIKI